MLSRGEHYLEFVKQEKEAFTNWPKPEVVLKGPDNIFCHLKKLPQQIPNETFWPKKLLTRNKTKDCHSGVEIDLS